MFKGTSEPPCFPYLAGVSHSFLPGLPCAVGRPAVLYAYTGARFSQAALWKCGLDGVVNVLAEGFELSLKEVEMVLDIVGVCKEPWVRLLLGRGQRMEPLLNLVVDVAELGDGVGFGV